MCHSNNYYNYLFSGIFTPAGAQIQVHPIVISREIHFHQLNPFSLFSLVGNVSTSWRSLMMAFIIAKSCCIFNQNVCSNIIPQSSVFSQCLVENKILLATGF